MATHSSILAWKIPRTEEPGRLYSLWGHKELIANEHKHSKKGKHFGKNSVISWKCQIIQAVIRETIRNLLDLLLFYFFFFCIFSRKTMSKFQWLKITEAYGLLYYTVIMGQPAGTGVPGVELGGSGPLCSLRDTGIRQEAGLLSIGS